MYHNTDKTIWLNPASAEETLALMEDNSVQLILTDLPWGTNGIREAEAGAYLDKSVSELKETFEGLLKQAKRVLTQSGTLCAWLDYRAGPYFAVWGDAYLDRVGEVIIHQELGNPGKKRWPLKHSTVYIFAKSEKYQAFDIEALPSVPRVGPVSDAYSSERRINSVVAGTFSNTNSERLGYPDQKPSRIYRMFVEAYTKIGDLVIDPFCGSGTLGEACRGTGRIALLGDMGKDAIALCINRFGLVPESED